MNTINNITKIKDIAESDLVIWLNNFMYDFSNKFGHELKDHEFSQLVENTKNLIKYQMSDFNIGNVKLIFEQGLAGKYDLSTRLNYRVVYRWFSKGKDEIYKAIKHDDDENADMPMAEKFTKLYRMADEKAKETGKENIFDAALKRLNEKISKNRVKTFR